MSKDKIAWDTRRIVWLIGWIVLASLIILIAWNQFASVDGHVSLLPQAVL